MAPHFLSEIVALLLAGAGISYVCFRLGLVPIVGFLVAGVVIGPMALGLVSDQELVDASAEVGVMLLLFTIGIEFSLDKLAKLRTVIFVGGGLQVGLASAAMLGLLAAFGVAWRPALFTGFLVALSSTAIVMKLLADRSETSSPTGQVALGLLVFQDLAVVVMVLLVPMLGGEGGSSSDLAWALGKALAIIAVVLVFARRLMPIVLEQVARTCSPELFLLTVMAICLGTAYLTSLAGVSLSLGAFLAGLVVSESRFSQHALGEILPLQILFSATFFVSVGMLLDVTFLVHHLPLVVAAIAAVLLVKVLTTAGSVLVLGQRPAVAVASTLMLAQVGEFSFVLERAGRDVGLTPAGLGASGSQAFIAATVVLMVATPLLSALGASLARRLEASIAKLPDEPEEVAIDPELAGLENHVIVAGYGQAARRLVRVLAGSSIPFIITTLSPEGALEAEAEGLPVLRGDATRQRTLEHAGVLHAKVFVVADDDPATAHRIAAVARVLNPTMRIVIRTRWIAEIEPLTHAGADRVIAEELESIVQLFADVMRSYDLPAEAIERNEEVIRRGGYAALRVEDPPTAPVVECLLGPDCLDRRTVTVRDGAPIVGRTVGELPVVAERLSRDGRTVPNPPDGEVLQPGDELVLAGTAGAFARSAPLFRTGELEPEALAAAMVRDEIVVDTERPVTLDAVPGKGGCTHLGDLRPVIPTARGCEECIAIGARWVHLRLCMTCGHVGCCDSSQYKHATAHFHAVGHPVMRSLQPGETWGWCYVDKVTL
ncbi:MAG TPA: cation:proton antiporter [Candidatus Binatia bacterium]|jgi:CPA2 family monovalent cation:H+ antiporter-2|nr:cation:proton antiporter [Candidatus Binatia bacterium]